VKPHHETPPRPIASPEPLKAATQPAAPLAQVGFEGKSTAGFAMRKMVVLPSKNGESHQTCWKKWWNSRFQRCLLGMNERLE
jgi:hypothetical protein